MLSEQIAELELENKELKELSLKKPNNPTKKWGVKLNKTYNRGILKG